ncbi:GPI mannosyltransferase 2 [Balamuthia mandrillaris]
MERARPSFEHGRTVLRWAVGSRVAVWLLGCVLGALVSDYDTSAFLFPLVAPTKPLDPWIAILFGPFARWDSVYFLRIAEAQTYEYEHFHAFFPGLPFLAALLQRIGWTVVGWTGLLSEAYLLLLVSFLLCNACFILSALQLQKLSVLILKDKRLATTATLLYCINPASIFMSAIYTESLFALLLFSALRLLQEGHSVNESTQQILLHWKTWAAAICGGLACLVRSNGIIACGFFLFAAFCHHYPRSFSFSAILKCLFVLAQAAAQCLILLSSMALYLYYAYSQFCVSYATASSLSPWCSSSLPNVYSYVQAKYWFVFVSSCFCSIFRPLFVSSLSLSLSLSLSINEKQNKRNNGLLHYYEWKQAPNFMLAAPMVFLSFCGIFSHFLWHNYSFHRLFPFFSSSKQNSNTKQQQRRERSFGGYYGEDVFVYVVYWTGLLSMGLLFMHVQVITRFLCSSCPPIWWFSASLFVVADGQEAEEEKWSRGWFVKRVLLAYFLLYIFVGTLLFCNFYPWT